MAWAVFSPTPVNVVSSWAVAVLSDILPVAWVLPCDGAPPEMPDGGGESVQAGPVDLANNRNDHGHGGTRGGGGRRRWDQRHGRMR